ncbi:carbamoyl-phosphate synthase large subunit [Candidatus Calescamantes bacterium]|nr:carbamoyl-phosphate synthase large subunit [Candidatus Calescamantes bacterium]
MPKRKDIKKILIIGSGPIVIGQACEFDYSGSQACKALKQEGYEVILVNSNPATIMTDPGMADKTYIEPLTPEVVEKIIARERPDACLPTMGGQTGLNIAAILAKEGVFDRYGVELIGAKFEAIRKAEERDLFRESMRKIGLKVPDSAYVRSVEEALEWVKGRDYPFVIRPSYTLAGTGGGVAYNVDELKALVQRGIEYSLIGQVLVEESVLGWKEYELEVMRDLKDNVVIICSIENFDPMGIHTGDSITVAPAQTLTDKEYQRMRDAAIAVIREVGVETGGSNIQFAVHPETGEMVVIEMNPRVSRSSALASKATGFPIAKFAAKLAIGYTLDEIPNDITKKTPACFEPTIDYCVVKMPRWDFEKFPDAEATLTTEMKSVGEAMAIGRNFKEALQKAIRSLEKGRMGLGADGKDPLKPPYDLEVIREKLKTPNAERVFYIRYAYLAGMSTEEIYELTKIDPWFLENIKEIVEMEDEIREKPLTPGLLRKAKSFGFSDVQIAHLKGKTEKEIRELREKEGIKPAYKLVDTCAGEFEAYTPYYYSAYEFEDEVEVSDRKKIMILGGGPNRIGQGIEFDYCCVQAAFALREEGFEVIMVNCNPETVSTDYDTSDRLYFEPLTLEDVLAIARKEKPYGVIVQLGGQTPLNLALALKREGVRVLGTDPEDINRAEDRKLFAELLHKLGLKHTPYGTGYSFEEAREIAKRIGYPVLVRPSYVLGGRAMEIVYDEKSLERYIQEASRVSSEHPILIDKFLESAIEVDVDAISDGEITVIGGVMEHIEEAGVHSGDSACALPPYSLSKEIVEELKAQTRAIAKELRVRGLINIQFAIQGKDIYVLEVNPRASRTVPFVGKATGIPLARLAAKVMIGKSLKELGFTKEVEVKHTAVKEAVFPFIRFPGVDIILGPEMKSTGEVMGIDEDFGKAFAKSQMAAGNTLPLKGTVFVSVADRDKKSIVPVVKKLKELGFEVIATKGTREYLKKAGIEVKLVNKIAEGRPHVVDYIKNGDIQLIINTPIGKGPKFDEYKIRREATVHKIPIITTIPGAFAAVKGIEALLREEIRVKSLQEYHSVVYEENHVKIL